MRRQNANQMVDSGQTKIKICGLYRDADIDAVNQYQPDYAGFVFYPPSHRYVTWEQMKDFREKLRSEIPAVGVCVNLPVEEVAAHLKEDLIQIAQLHGTEDEAYLQKAASYVNEKITTMHALPGFSKQSADYQQLMLLLNIADDYFKTKETADQMEEQRDRMEKETYSLKHELVSTQMKLDGVLKDLEERQRQLQELSAKLSKSERELRAAKKQAALAATSENGEEEVVEDEVVDTVIEGDEPVSESVPALDETAAAQATESGFVQADMPMQNPSFQTKTGLSDQELARKALQAARKAGSHRNGRR